MIINTIYEDNDIVIIDKPAGILVHPTLANETDTLVSFLIKKYPELNNLAWPDKTRIGVVHRLDKDTSGIIIMAKKPEILVKLQEQFKNREVKKNYTALAYGKVEKKEDEIVAAITRGENGLQKIQDQKYSFDKNKIRPAVTKYKVLNTYKYNDEILSLIEAMPQTGRMHQIRVHMKYIDHPIIGDQLYNNKMSRKLSQELNLNRQFLHAKEIEFVHPATNEKMSFQSKLPEDLTTILNKLEKIQ